MIPKRELTQEQIEEIQALRGRLSADEVKKRFCIGSSRLYRIWRDKTADRVTQKALPPAQTADRVTQNTLPPADRVTQTADGVTQNTLPPRRPPTTGTPRRLAPRRNPNHRRLLQTAGGHWGPSRAIYETTDGGDDPVGAQQQAGGGARRAGGGARRAGGETRRGNPDEYPESRTNRGNGPKVDLPFHRRNTRLENSWSNLEAMRASRTGTNCRTETNCRAKSCEDQEGPLLHGVGHLDVDSCCRTDMEIGRRRGGPPRFPFELFWEHQRAYDSGPERRAWESFEDLRRATARESSATIQGHIDAETAINWLRGGSDCSTPWVIAGMWCFAPTAGLWWSGTLLF